MAPAQADQPAPKTPAPWHAAYPAPSNPKPDPITREEVLNMMKTGEVAGRDFILVDLRRTDHEGGTIRGSINLPAQSVYLTLPTLYTMCRSAGLHKVIWYCSSSRGRGTRAAGWFVDYLTGQADNNIQSLVLSEGIKGWANAGEEFVERMDGYKQEAWLGN